MKRHLDALLPALTLLGALLVLLPVRSEGYTVFGDRLDLYQRDFRIWNNFTDPEANSNLVPDPDFPGALGAELAIWKGVAEWGSVAHGSGKTDPTQDFIGSGGSNFDAFYSARSGGPGNTNANVISQLDGSLFIKAYCEIPIRDGWRIRFSEDPWTWNDSPLGILQGPDAWDIQGIACHEYGHALGLNHSTDSSATMFPSPPAGAVAMRSIEADDMLGVQHIYGVRSPSKAKIDGYELQGGGVLLYGSNFHPTQNQVWFTHRQLLTGPEGTPVRVFGVASSAGGTQLFVQPPPASGPGDIIVRRPGNQPEDLSNAFPFDPTHEPLMPPVVYGTGKTSSAGVEALLGWETLPSTMIGSFRVHVDTGVVGGATGILYSGPTRTQRPLLGGDLLVGGPLKREVLAQIGFFGEVWMDVPVPPDLVGTSRFYQFWFADSAASFGSGLTNGLKVTFSP